jgi:hypothetical protein
MCCTAWTLLGRDSHNIDYTAISLCRFGRRKHLNPKYLFDYNTRKRGCLGRRGSGVRISPPRPIVNNGSTPTMGARLPPEAPHQQWGQDCLRTDLRTHYLALHQQWGQDCLRTDLRTHYLNAQPVVLEVAKPVRLSLKEFHFGSRDGARSACLLFDGGTLRGVGRVKPKCKFAGLGQAYDPAIPREKKFEKNFGLGPSLVAAEANLTCQMLAVIRKRRFSNFGRPAHFHG